MFVTSFTPRKRGLIALLGLAFLSVSPILLSHGMAMQIGWIVLSLALIYAMLQAAIPGHEAPSTVPVSSSASKEERNFWVRWSRLSYSMSL